jgi:hypothetical protein
VEPPLDPESSVSIVEARALVNHPSPSLYCLVQLEVEGKQDGESGMAFGRQLICSSDLTRRVVGYPPETFLLYVGEGFDWY